MAFLTIVAQPYLTQENLTFPEFFLCRGLPCPDWASWPLSFILIIVAETIDFESNQKIWNDQSRFLNPFVLLKSVLKIVVDLQKDQFCLNKRIN